MREKCITRNDEWGKVVLGQLEYAQDLPAVEARYNQTCSANFRSGRNIPAPYQPSSDKKNKKGRPMHIFSEKAILEVITYFRNIPDEQVTVYDLINKMADLCDEPYGFTCMKILDHFGGTVITTELDGKHNVVTIKDKIDAILHSFYQRNNKQDAESEKGAVIKTAANLKMSDIKSIRCTKEDYPNPEKLKSINTNSDFVPDSLTRFLKSSNFSKKYQDH